MTNLIELKKQKGFSLIELMVAVSIIGILLAIAIPGFIKMAPRMKLKGAARDVVSDIQLAKTMALRDRKTYSIQFDSSGYTVRKDGTVKKTVNISDYPGVQFGSGHGKISEDLGAGNTSDGVTFDGNKITFNTNSTIGKVGGVYLKNDDNTTYAVLCISTAGGVKTLKNLDGSGWE